jgi:hypothetical protein
MCYCLGEQDIWSAGDTNKDGMLTFDELRQMAAHHFTSSVSPLTHA